MNLQDYMTRPLSTDYVANMIEKLTRTTEKYQYVIPQVDDFVQDLCSKDYGDDFFQMTMLVVEALQRHKDDSPIMKEIAKNWKMDIWHGLNEKLPKHTGEYYIDSVAD